MHIGNIVIYFVKTCGQSSFPCETINNYYYNLIETILLVDIYYTNTYTNCSQGIYYVTITIIIILYDYYYMRYIKFKYKFYKDHSLLFVLYKRYEIQMKFSLLKI